MAKDEKDFSADIVECIKKFLNETGPELQKNGVMFDAALNVLEVQLALTCKKHGYMTDEIAKRLPN